MIKKQLYIGIGIIVIASVVIILVMTLFRSDRNTVTPPDTLEPSDVPVDDVTTAENLFPDDNDRDGISNAEEEELGLDNTNFDTDGDGLADAFELQVTNTDPLNPDTDADGVSDGAEYITFGTNPLSSDTDGDGYFDGAEIDAGYSPLCTGNVLLFEPCLEN